MDDDLDTPGALAGVFELVSAAHSAADAGDQDEGAAWPDGGRPGGGAGRSPPGGVRRGGRGGQPLVAQRDEARLAKDFARADALRDELVALGWTVEDTPSGTAIRR